MKANEFIRKFGWGEAKFYLGNAHKDALWVSFDLPEHGIKDIVIYVPDLKRLVESHELVEKHGGLIESKIYVECCNDIDLSKAIADVESCQ